METCLTKAIEFLLRLFHPLFKKILPYPVYSYLVCGAANTVLNIALFAFFYQVILPLPGLYAGKWLIPSYTISLVIAFVITVPTGFWLNKQFAFKQENKSPKIARKQLLKYFLVVSQGLLSDYLIMLALIKWAGVYPTIAKIISTIVTLTINFLLQKHFTFKKEKPTTYTKNGK